MSDILVESAPAVGVRPSLDELRRWHSFTWLLGGFVALLAVISVAWCGIAILRGSGLSHESGVMTALAIDLHHGVFYRPIAGAAGYGGTRYGPSFVLLQAGLMSLGLGAIASGHVACVAAALALLAGIFTLLVYRRGTALALLFILLLFVSQSTVMLLSGVRADFLATAANVWGILLIAAAVPAANTRRQNLSLLLGASALFAIAMVTKFSCGFGVAAAVLWLVRYRRFREAICVGLCTAVTAALVIVAANYFSHGRLWHNYTVCATRPPLGFHGWLHQLSEVAVVLDWPGTMLVLLALVAWIFSARPYKNSLAAILLLVTFVATLPMFLSPGIGLNHVIDLQVAAVLFLGVVWHQLPAQRVWTVLLCVIVLCALGRFCQKRNLARALYHNTDAFRHAVAMAHPAAGPILSDNAEVPVAAGQSPFMLDDFSFPMVRAAVPSVQHDLYARLDNRFFGAVILRYDPATGDRPWVLGRDFRRHLLAHYQLVGRWDLWDHLWIYRPKSS